jgi:HK97 family phage prohead protease
MTNKAMETKCLSGGMEFKFNEEAGTFEGYASVFGGLDSYNDTVMKGAYEETLKERERPVRMRWNHFGEVVGKWLEIREDDKGLYVKGQLTPNHSKANDIRALLKHGAIDGLSIGYFIVDDEPNGYGGRNLKQIELIEISIVEEPADLGASITGIKTKLEKAESLADIEASLRDAGFSRSSATALVSRIKTLAQRDVEQEVAAEQKSAFQQLQDYLNLLTEGNKP